MDRIITDPGICSGKPIIRGTRVMVRNILGMMASGATLEGTLKSYPQLSAEDVSAALDYAARLVDSVQPSTVA